MWNKIKNVLRNVLLGAAWLVGIVAPFAAGIAAKEESNTVFVQVVGWITMAEVAVLSAVVLWLKSKGRLSAKNDEEGK